MSDDDDFRKDVIEQKIKKVVEEIGFTKKIVYKVENQSLRDNVLEIRDLGRDSYRNSFMA